jgi:hypothetical protein
VDRPVAVLTLLALACTGEPATPPVPSCEDGAATGAATAADRRLLGLASGYPADAMLAARHDELLLSERARRAAAWEVVARVLAPIALAEPTAVPDATVPRFRTWYDTEDFTRVFHAAYEGLGPDGRAARARLDDAAIDTALDANVRTTERLGWTDERWDAHVAMITDAEAVANVGGLGRIVMSGETVRHIVRSYPEIVRCLDEGAAPVFADGEASQELAHELVLLSRCERRVFGPYWVASGGRLHAELAPGEGSALATVRLLAGATSADAIERCVTDGDGACETDGPGAVFVEVAAGGIAVDARLEVTYGAPDVPFAGCLESVFPIAAATVAEEWRRVELGPLPTYDTSAAGLTRRLADGAEGTWGEGDGSADPGPDAIYTQSVGEGSTFRLAGMHIRTRELEHWMNITIWWSDTPDEGFGADRPEAIRALGAPWSSYAMCVAIDDIERDPDPEGGFADDAPTLAAALAAVRAHAGSGGASWCSNPYIDGAPGLLRTNCVGCHQHAMTGVRPGEVLMDESRFPESGRLFVRSNFPADAFWGLDAGDSLAEVIQATVEYWDAAP